MPPPSVSPAIPVVETTPPVTAKSVQLRLSIEVGPGRPALRPDRPATRIDVNTLHPRQVDHQAAFYDGSSRNIVPPAANREFQAEAASKLDSVDDVRGPAALGDQRRPFVHHAVVDTPRGVVARVARLEQQA